MEDPGAASKLVFLETFGCQMNESDSERMLGILKGVRYSRTEEPEKADLILINTCSIRDKAEQKVYSTLGRFKALKAGNPSLIIGVGGCVAQQEGERLLKRAPHLDIVFGPHNVHKLKDLLSEAAVRKRVVAVAQSGAIDEDEYAMEPFATGEKAFVSIMRGCDNFCAYCIVPYTRGREVSRDCRDVLDEVRALARKGVKEVTLIGQNVNSYGKGGDVTFPGLLRMVSAIEGILRVRFITSHPKDISGELIGLFGEEKKLCSHLHLPVQSGSDQVLKSMGRGYTRDEYLRKIELIKGLYTGMSLTTDIIVGFPGETEADFLDTMELVRTVRFDNIFSFMYSPRPGTRASGLPDLPVEVKSERLQVLQEAQREITTERNLALLGRTIEVLVEGESRASASELMGRTSCNRIVNFPAPEGALKSGMMEVTITRAFQNSLRGVLSGNT